MRESERQCGLCGEIAVFVEEGTDEVDGRLALDGEHRGQAGSDYFRLLISGQCLETEEKCRLRAAYLCNGPCALDPHRFVGVHQGLDQVRQHGHVGQRPALDESERTLRAQSAGHVLYPTPDGFHLNVAETGEEDVRLVVTEFGQRLRDAKFGPALRVGLRGVVEEATEGGDEVGDKFGEAMVSDDRSGLSDEVVALIADRFTQFDDQGRSDWFGFERVDSLDLLVVFLHAFLHATIRRMVRVALMLWWSAVCVSAATATLDGFDAFMEKAMRDIGVQGAAVAVVQDGRLVFAKGYGLRDSGHRLPVTTKTLFPIASITKSFTVTALGTLVDEGKLEWDRPVREYLPGFRMFDPVATEQLTARDMVTHRSGLPRHDLLWYTSSFSREQLVERLRYLEPNKPLRTTFQYNNLMFITAGYLAGKIHGTSWEELVREKVLSPLGMTGTRLNSLDARKVDDYAFPYRRNWKTDDVRQIEFSNWGDVGPAGSIHSNIEDMARYLLLHVNKGEFGGRHLLSRNNAEQMQTPQMVIRGISPYPELSENNYGMGFFIQNYRGHRTVSHGGNLDGFSLQLSFLPEKRTGVVVLTNLSGTPVRDFVPWYVYDRVLGLEPVDWSARYHEVQRKSKLQTLEAESKGYTGQKKDTRPSHRAEGYEGEYAHPGYGTMRISRRPGGDGFEMALNDVRRPVDHFHYDTFQVPADPLDPFEKLKITFQTDPQGEIASLSATLDGNVKDIVFERVADKRMFEPSFLSRFAGEYDAPGRPWTVVLSAANVMQVVFPGQTPRKLIPRRGTRFDLQDATGVSLEFHEDASGQVTEAVLFTPDNASLMKRR